MFYWNNMKILTEIGSTEYKRIIHIIDVIKRPLSWSARKNH
ncbi:hypothetical protein CIT292_07282 [Citrobacter youngae ATCC 29220]|uniref:Uncharacterized protein n=1 Tax=Citrobacter youngae ATCC 29220 TaxID=500640 RepID=D4B9Z2_9ENTR|nr:hypothetical protein CIT292_07282 [Citrobacter youngae ATCC 29220]